MIKIERTKSYIDGVVVCVRNVFHGLLYLNILFQEGSAI